ncbi:acyl-CoA reductase [Jiulongibacter sediminis]|uniref:acyl-CoA reductase n=1 Tax=Jiulongibacter sediminis TaxID=1605367 RepID=UPI0026ED3E6C|nr:acyl-CoA reductase [Jiulongibacter sediminis]
MTLKSRIVQFSTLGDFLTNPENETEMKDWAARAKNENGWFTEDNVLLSLKEIGQKFLSKEALESFTTNVSLPTQPKRVGIVAAGNIPLVGFHDMLCVLLSGHKALLKLSSNDTQLMLRIIQKMQELAPEYKEQLEVVDRIKDADAYIATGSDNSSRYFEHYFGKKPSIIRKNRSSVAVLTGNESTTDLRNLGNDIFRYFGLGCRNVSKIFVPKDYKFDTLYESIEYWNTIQLHHKYNNNYDYNKSIYLVNGDKHFDNGFLLLKEDERLVSPLSVVFYEHYENEADLNLKLQSYEGKLQCIVGESYIPFGESQSPNLNDFADGVNTMDFLMSL